MKLIMPRTCSVCGRRGVNGTSRCERHPPAPRPSEAERLVSEPHRRGYRDPEYRRLRPIVIAEADGVCEICGEDMEPDEVEVDHIGCLRDGGLSVRANLRAAHRRCNQAKKAADRRARKVRDER